MQMGCLAAYAPKMSGLLDFISFVGQIPTPGQRREERRVRKAFYVVLFIVGGVVGYIAVTA